MKGQNDKTIKKFKVRITEILETEIEVEAENLQQVIHELKQGHEEAGKVIKPMATEELTAVIYSSNGSMRTVRLI